jgi:Na+/melibiose symporter-like transporter
VEQINSTAVTFKVRPMVDSPLWITFITSFNLIFAVIIGATANYASDRLWTRWGRRRPFIIVGQAAMFIGLLLLPLTHSLGPLIVIMLCWDILRDLNTPFEPLLNEVVPPQQRGRSAAMGKIFRTVATAFFFGVMIVQYDRVYSLPYGITLTGEHLTFWVGALFALYTLLLMVFCVKETALPANSPQSEWRGLKPAIRGYFTDVFGDAQWRALYWVALAMAIFWLGLGSLGALLQTEQFGYSKSVYGYVVAFGTPFNILLFLPLGGWLADKIDRMLIFKAGAIVTAILHLSFYYYARYLSPNGIPSVTALVIFGLITTGATTVAAMAANPLIFDFVPRDKLGTVSSGIGAVRGAALVLVNNGTGLWVTLWSKEYAPKGKFDYLSGYLYLTILALIGTAVVLWFERQVLAGRFVKYGRQEHDRDAAAVAAK